MIKNDYKYYNYNYYKSKNNQARDFNFTPNIYFSPILT